MVSLKAQLYLLKTQSLCPATIGCLPCTDLREHLSGTQSFIVRLAGSTLQHAVERINHRNQNASKTGYVFYYYRKAGDLKSQQIHVHAQAGNVQIPNLAGGPFILLRTLGSYEEKRGNMAGLCTVVPSKYGQPLTQCPGTETLYGRSMVFYFPQLNGGAKLRLQTKTGRFERQSFPVNMDSAQIAARVGLKSVVEVCGNPHISAVLLVCQLALQQDIDSRNCVETARLELCWVPPEVFFEWVFGCEDDCIGGLLAYMEQTECVPVESQAILRQPPVRALLRQALWVLGRHINVRRSYDAIYDYLWLYARPHQVDFRIHNRNFRTVNLTLPSCAAVYGESTMQRVDGDNGDLDLDGSRKRGFDEPDSTDHAKRIAGDRNHLGAFDTHAGVSSRGVEGEVEGPRLWNGTLNRQPTETPINPQNPNQNYTPETQIPTPPCLLPQTTTKSPKPTVLSESNHPITHDIAPQRTIRTVPIEEQLLETYESESKWAAAEMEKLTNLLSELEHELSVLRAVELEPTLLQQWGEGAVRRLAGVGMGLPVVLLGVGAIRGHRGSEGMAPLWLRAQFHHSRTVTGLGQSMLGPLARLFLESEAPHIVPDMCMRQLAGGCMDTLYRRLYAIEPPQATQIAVALPRIILDLPEISDVLWAANIPVIETPHPTVQLLSSDQPLIDIAVSFSQSPFLPPDHTAKPIHTISVCVSEATVHSDWLTLCATCGIVPVRMISLGSLANFLVLLARNFQLATHEPPSSRVEPRGPPQVVSVGQLILALAQRVDFGWQGPVVVVMGARAMEGRMDWLACLYAQARALPRCWWPVLCCGPDENIERTIQAADTISSRWEREGWHAGK